MSNGIQTLSNSEKSEFSSSASADDGSASSTNLTSGQLQVWIAQMLFPNSPLFHVAGIWKLHGKVDVEHFQKAFRTLLLSSDALRTVIREKDGVPRWIVLDDIPFHLEMLDFSSNKNSKNFLDEWCRKRVTKSFNLAERLVDAAWIKLSEEEFNFYLNMHHLVSDGWTIALISRLLSDFYGRSLQGALKERESLPQFEDYVRYEREVRASSTGKKNEQYWKGKLSCEVDPLVFYGRSLTERTTQILRLSCVMGSGRSERLQQAIKQLGLEGGSHEKAVLEIFFAIMAAYIYLVTGRDRFSIGIPIHNRRNKRFKETIGFFSEVVPVNVEIQPEETFQMLIQKIKHQIYEALRHGPFSPVAPQHRQSSAVILNLHVPFFGDLCGIPGQVEWVNTGHALETLSIQLHGFNPSEEMKLEFDFNRNLFAGDLPDRVLTHFLSVMDAFLADPTTPLSKVSLLSDGERDKLLIDWNATVSDYPEICAHQWFEEQAARTPHEAAVVYGGQKLTYQDLNQRASHCAQILQGSGVKPGDFVGICMERSLDTIVGVVGILKSGAAYVPLDPAYPSDRLAFMLEDSGAPVLLTQRQLVSNLPPYRGRIICLDEFSESSRQEASLPRVTPDGPAYMIYTSGSTGKPKGVVMCHRPLVNLLKWQLRDSGLPAKACTLQFASLSFDVSFQEIFSTLCSGATLVLIKDDLRLDALALLAYLREQKVERLFLPFVALQNLAEAARESADLPDTLTQIITAGEQLQITPGLVHFMNRLKKCVLQNQYGPTESHVVTAYTLESPAEKWPSLPPIGRPINNTQIYLLDTLLRPVPVGIPGELHIGGICLARDYYHRPDLTTEKFISNPFDVSSGSRLYKTGDLASYLPDGNIEFLGRIDHQIKIRGFRIELGEIEALLSQHPDLKDVVVTARDQGELKRLVGYVVLKPGKTIEVADLRKFLKGRLPDYMVPAAFVIMSSFPMTPSGKVDRKSLPPPDQAAYETAEAHVPPRNETEQKLVEIWKEVLGLSKIGVRDNFFEIGGHSLMAVKMFSKIKTAFDNYLPLTAIFNAPTIERLALLLNSKDGSSSSWSNLVPIQSEGKGLPIFWIHTLGGGGGGGLFRYKKLVEFLDLDQPSYGIQAPPEPFDVLEIMAAHYIEWIKGLQPQGPYHLVGYCFGGNVAYEMARQLRAKGEEVAFLGILDGGAFPPSNRPKYSSRLRMVFDFLVNFYHWLPNFFRQKPAQHLLRLKRRLRSMKRRKQMTSMDWKTQQDVITLLELEEVIDVAQYPEEYRKYAATHWHAFLNYRPKPYDGAADIFLVRQHGLLEFEPTLGWQYLVRGRLKVHTVPGSHDTLFDEPYVRCLAEQIKAALQESSRSSAAG